MLTIGAGLLGVYYFANLETVPGTNRKRFVGVPRKVEEFISANTYRQLMQEYQRNMLPPTHPISTSVEEIAKRIIAVSGLDHLDWQVHIVDSHVRNAFVIPSGKIFVFTGILKVANTTDKIAAVLGHEVVSFNVDCSCHCSTWCGTVILQTTTHCSRNPL
jgi:predicted Zn-dependent protease